MRGDSPFLSARRKICREERSSQNGREEQASNTPSPVVLGSRGPSPSRGRRPGVGRAFQAAAPLPRAPLAMWSSACVDKRAHHPLRLGVGPEPSAHVSHPQAAACSRSRSWEAATHLTPPPGPLEGLVFSKEGGLSLNRGGCQGNLEAWQRDHAPGNAGLVFLGWGGQRDGAARWELRRRGRGGEARADGPLQPQVKPDSSSSCKPRWGIPWWLRC